MIAKFDRNMIPFIFEDEPDSQDMAHIQVVKSSKARNIEKYDALMQIL